MSNKIFTQNDLDQAYKDGLIHMYNYLRDWNEKRTIYNQDLKSK